MKIGIYSSGYPSEGDKYNYAFVHLRSKLYKKAGHDVKVFRDINEVSTSYKYEGIDVFAGKHDYLHDKIKNFNPDIICIHSPEFFFHSMNMFNLSEKLIYEKYPIIVWIHGFETLSLKYYSPNIFDIKSFLKYFYTFINHYVQLKKIKKFLNFVEKKKKCKIVFVSRWQKEESEKSLSLKFRNYEIIPNPVDKDLFKYKKKKVEDRFKMLTIRPLNNKKYAVDIAINSVANLNRGSLDIYGKGYLFDKYKKLSQKSLIPINFKYKFIDHQKIPNIHSKYGLFISPSRTDAQGVSMCEAMASGLPVITSNIGGIPEFVKDGVSGFVCNSSKEAFEKIKYLQDNPKKYLKMSDRCSKEILKICSSEIIIKREINLMNIIRK